MSEAENTRFNYLIQLCINAGISFHLVFNESGRTWEIWIQSTAKDDALRLSEEYMTGDGFILMDVIDRAIDHVLGLKKGESHATQAE